MQAVNGMHNRSIAAEQRRKVVMERVENKAVSGALLGVDLLYPEWRAVRKKAWRKRAALQIHILYRSVQSVDEPSARCAHACTNDFSRAHDDETRRTSVLRTKQLLYGLSVVRAHKNLAHIRECDRLVECMGGKKGWKAFVLECESCLVVKVRRMWPTLKRGGFGVNVRRGKLSDAVNPNLLWRRAKRQGMTVPEDDV